MPACPDSKRISNTTAANCERSLPLGLFALADYNTEVTLLGQMLQNLVVVTRFWGTPRLSQRESSRRWEASAFPRLDEDGL